MTDMQYIIPELESERILLRKFRQEDAEDIFNYGNDPMVSRYVPWDAPESIDVVNDYLERCFSKYETGPEFDLAIVWKERGRVIGGCGFDKIDTAHSWGEVGYTVSREYWDQGIATEAMKLLVGFGFSHMNLNRIEAVCMMENKGSERVMQKLGMTFDAILRGRFYAQGTYHDGKMYAILKENFYGEGI